MDTYVIATNNAHKLQEIRDILETDRRRFLSMKEAKIATDPEENGLTFEENALIKARAACKASGLPALADDSGLEVDALGGEPGIRSARYCEGSDQGGLPAEEAGSCSRRAAGRTVRFRHRLRLSRRHGVRHPGHLPGRDPH